MGNYTAQKLLISGFVAALMLATAFMLVVPVSASVDNEINDLQDEVADRKAQIDRINKKMDAYQDKVRELGKKTATLLNDISIIENQIAIAELDVEATQNQIESKQLEIKILKEKIKLANDDLSRQRIMLKEMIFEMNRRSEVSFIEVLFGADDFSELFAEIEQLESVNRDLNKTLGSTKITKETLENNHQKQEEGLNELVELQSDLKISVARLNVQQLSKDLLVDETQYSEAQYRVLMSELRQESQFVTNQLATIQAEIEARLIAENGGGEDGSLMTSPLADYITTATFHDPTYPFRYLWEHSGYDMAAPTGTPIMSAAPGIVAWTKTGRSYGNYVMVIHAGGYATLYAHMSRFNVSTDDFVARGQVIGYVGSTGFSTGPHLHFEVRRNGIPVDPAANVIGLQ